MARRLYSTLFISGHLAAGETFTYDLQEGFVYVVRDISGLIYPGLTTRTYLDCQWDGFTFAQFYAAPGPTHPYHWEGRVALPGANTITITHSSYDLTSASDVFISGYMLTL